MDTQPAPVPVSAPAPAPGVLQEHALPTPVAVPEVTVPVVPKHFLAAFFLSFFLGVFGADRFYLGRYPSAIFKLLTFGGFGIQAIVDLALIMNNALHDRYDRPLVGYDEYKGLAKRTVMWVTIGAGVFILINGIFLVIGVEQAVKQFTSGNNSLTNLTSGGGSASGLSGLGGL